MLVSRAEGRPSSRLSEAFEDPHGPLPELIHFVISFVSIMKKNSRFYGVGK